MTLSQYQFYGLKKFQNLNLRFQNYLSLTPEPCVSYKETWRNCVLFQQKAGEDDMASDQLRMQMMTCSSSPPAICPGLSSESEDLASKPEATAKCPHKTQTHLCDPHPPICPLNILSFSLFSSCSPHMNLHLIQSGFCVFFFTLSSFVEQVFEYKDVTQPAHICLI